MSSPEIIELRTLLARRLLAHRKITRTVRFLTNFVRNKGVHSLIVTNTGPVTSAEVFVKTHQAYLASLRNVTRVRRKLARLEFRGAPPLSAYLDSLIAAPPLKPALLLGYKSKEV